MTTVIDERVVEMRFNNADFEKNVAQSMSTLEKLKNSLNFDSAKSLEAMGKASKQFSMENVGNQVETIQTKFSALQVVGITALAEITKAALNLGSTLVHKIIDPISSGGMKRALNIEQAKFQLEGLHVEWNAISDDINYGVKDTAYGLDAAAKAASQLVTSGVQFGEAWGETGNSPMARALRGISGVAAMTSSTYEDISDIFTSIAGKGKAMTAEFNRLGQRGLNAAGAVADYFNKVTDGTIETTDSVKNKIQAMTGGLHVTELEIRDFASKSKIDFELFSYAMDDAFGEHAKEANKTFTGALSNVKAALSRIGAKFATPYIENARKVFNNLIPVLDAVNKALDPVADRASRVMGIFQEALGEFLNSEGIKTGITTIINSLVRGFDGLVRILTAVKLAFETVFPKNGAGETFLKVADAVSQFIDKVVNLVVTENTLKNIILFMQGIFNVGKLVVDIFKAVIHAILPVEHPLETLFTITMNILGLIGTVLTVVSTLIRENLSLSNVLSLVVTIAATVADILLKVAAVVGGGIIFAIKNFGNVVNWVLNILKNFGGFINSVFNDGLNKAIGKLDKLTRMFKGVTSHGEKATTVVKKMEENYGAAGDSAVKFGTLTRDATEEVENSTKAMSRLELVIHNIKSFFVTTGTTIAGAVAAIGVGIFKFFTDFAARFREATANANGFLDYIKAFFTTVGSYLGDIGTKISEFFTKLGLTNLPIIQRLKEIGTAIKEFIANLGAGRLTALAFAAAMTGLVVAVVRAAVAFSTMVISVRRVFTTIETILKSKFFTTKQPSLIIQLAEAFAIMAVSLALLTNLVDPNDLAKTSAVMKDLMITFTICAGALRLLDFVISKMGLFSNFKLVNSTVLSLAVSMGILVAAFAVLNKVEIAKDWSKKLWIMAIMFAEVGAAAVIISKFAPRLAGGSILMLTLALAMKTMVDAFAKIKSEDLTAISENIVGFTAVFLAVAALTAAAGRLRLSSALALLIIAKSFSTILPMLEQAIASFTPLFSTFGTTVSALATTVDQIKQDFVNMLTKLNGFFKYIQTTFSEIPATVITCVSTVSMALTAIGAMASIVAGGFAIAAIIRAIGSLGNLLKGFAIAVIGVAVAIKIVTDSFITIGNYLKELDSSQQLTIMSGFATIAVILTGMVGIVILIDAFASLITRNAFFNGKTVRTSFLGIGAAFAGIALALLLISKTLNNLEKIPEDRFWDLIKGISLILVALGVAAAGAGLITKGVSSMLGLIGVVAAFGLLLAGVAVLSAMWTPENDTAMRSAFQGLIVIALSLSAVLLALSRLKNPTSILSLMIPTLLMLVTVCGTLLIIGRMTEFNTGAVVATFIGLGVVLGVTIALLSTISRSTGLGNVKKIGVLLAATALLAVVATALVGLALTINYVGAGAILGAFITLNAQIIVVIGIMQTIANMKAIGSGLKSKLTLLGACIATLAVCVGALMVMGALCKDLGWSMLSGFALLNAQLLIITTMFTHIAKMKNVGTGLKSKITLLGACIAALAVCAGALMIMGAACKDLGWHMLAGFIVLNMQLGIIIGMMYLITRLNVTDNFWRRIILLGSCIAALITVAVSLGLLAKTVAKYGLENFNAAFKALALTFTAFGGVLAAVGLVADFMDTWSKTVGAIGLIISGIGAIAAIAYALYELSAINPAQLESATNAMRAIIVAMGVLTVVAGVLQIILVTIGSALGSAAGGWAGAVALPLLIASIGASVALMGVGLLAGAKAIDILATALGRLIAPLKQIGELPMAQIAENLMAFGTAMVHAGLGLAVFDVFAGAGMLVIALLTLALAALNQELPTFTKSVNELAAVDVGSIAAQLVELGLAGLVLEAGAPGVAAFALAMGGLSAALNAFGGTDGGVAAIKEAGETMETFTVKSQTYGAEFGGNYASGILTKEGEVKEATTKVVNGQVEILDEAVPKASEATKEMGNVILQGTEYTYEEVSKMARKYGYGTTDDFIKAAKANLVQLNPKGFVERKAEEVVNAGGKAITEGVDKYGKEITDKIQNFDISQLLSHLPSQFGDIGTLCGALLGQNASRTAADMISKMLGSFDWMFKSSGLKNAVGKEISQFGANGMTTEAMNAMYKGVASTSSKLLNSGLGGFFDEITTKGKNVVEALTDTGTAFENAGASGSKGSKGVKDFADSLRSGLDLFSKFEVKNEMTSKQLLENMQSNIDGYASWSHRMTVLAKRFSDNDIPVTLLEKLRDDGPKQQEVMNAIYNMTDEELSQLRELYATGMALPESQAAIIGDAFTYMGEMATQGFSNALDEHDKAHAAAHGLGEAALDGLKEALDVHSPSKATEQIGDFLVQGLALGILSDASTWKLTFAVVRLSDMLVELFNTNLAPEKMQVVGETMIEGLFTNALKNMDKENPIITAFANSLMEVGPVLEALTLFVEYVISKLNEGFKMGDSTEPSLLFYEYGRSSITGYANGINNNTAYVIFAITVMCSAALSKLNSMNLPTRFYEYGKNATMGFANGIADSEAAKKVMDNAQKIAEEAAKKMKEGLKESSPSKVTRQIGVYASEGLAIGIEDGASNVYKAAQSVTEGAIDAMSENGRIQDILNEGIDLNPVITPMLDLSILQAQMADLNAMFGARDAYLAAQNGGKFSANPDQPQQINFTQNNYSPKELSRYDIYRNTKNQISMMKGVIAHA